MTIYNAKSRETIASIATAVGFTAAKLTPGLEYALIQVVGGDCRFCIDGTTPTNDLGIHLNEDGSCEIWGTKAMKNFLCIDDTGTAKLEVIYMER
jgi:hypothetical protein